MDSWIKVLLRHERPGSTAQQPSRTLRGSHAGPMTVREAALIVANADGGLFPAADTGILAVIDEAHRTVRAARNESRPELHGTRRGKAITGGLIGAATAMVGAAIWFIPLASHLAG